MIKAKSDLDEEEIEYEEIDARFFQNEEDEEVMADKEKEEAKPQKSKSCSVNKWR